MSGGTAEHLTVRWRRLVRQSGARRVTAILAAVACFTARAGLAHAAVPAAEGEPEGRWALDLNAGVPKVGTDTFNIDADGAVGYSARRFGFSVHGRRATLDSQLDGRDILDVRTLAGGTAWYDIGRVDDPVGVRFGFDGEFAQYFTSLTVLTAPASTNDETSQMFRGTLKAGAWWRPSDVLELRPELAGGLQREAYQQEVVDTGTGAGLSQSDQNTSSLIWRGRVLGVWRCWPDVLRLGVLARGDSFSLTRSRADVRYVLGQDFNSQNVVSSAARLEASLRLMLDADALRFFGIAPGLYAQVETVRTTSDGSTVASTVPSAGIGFRSVYVE
jgi:hypothetical protein